MSTQSYPPGPNGFLPGLPLLAFTRDPLGFLTNVASTYGDISHFGFGSQKFFVLNHPDYIKDVLVTHNGNFMKGRGLQRAKRLLGEGAVDQ